MSPSPILRKLRLLALLLPAISIFSALELACAPEMEEATGNGEAASTGVRGDDDAVGGPGYGYGYGYGYGRPGYGGRYGGYGGYSP